MHLTLRAEASRPRRRPSIFIHAASASLRAVFPLLLLLPLPFFAQSSSVGSHRCLLVVETSRSMQRRAQGVSKTVKELLDSSLHGQLHETDSVALWTYSDNLVTNQFLPWVAQTKIGLALRVADLLQPATYEKKASLDTVIPEIMRVLGQSDLSTALLVCSGEDKVQGTPLDQQLNDACKQWQSEVLQARMPVVILLRASHGQITDWSVSPATWPIDLPPLAKTKVTVSTASQAPAVALAPNSPETNPAPTIAKAGAAAGQAPAAPPSIKPVSVRSAAIVTNTPSTEAKLAPDVPPTKSDNPSRPPEQTPTTVAVEVASTKNPVPQTSTPSPSPAPPKPGVSAPPQVQAVETALATTVVPAEAKPALAAVSQTSPPQSLTEVPQSKNTNLSPQSPPTPPAQTQPVPLSTTPSVASVPPIPTPPVQSSQTVTDAPTPITSSVLTSVPNNLASDSRPSAAIPVPSKPVAQASSSVTLRNSFTRNAIWTALLVVSALAAIYFIWSWLATYFRPRPQERIILQRPRPTSAYQTDHPAPSSAPKTALPTVKLIDRNRPPPVEKPSP